MTTEQQLDRLAQIAATALESIQALERVTATHTDQIGRIEQILTALAEAQVETGKRMDQITREWQAYLRRIPSQ